MQVLSFNWTIVAPAGQVVIRKNPAIADTAILHHPLGTVLELDEDEAQRLLVGGYVERYDPELHGEDPVQMLARGALKPGMPRTADQRAT